jgi:solute carrier family 25 (adenine nucleotide translocator) protein 4/5/6/31
LKPAELRYTGIVDCLVNIPKREGFWSLWRGNTMNVVRYFPTQALNFAFKDKFKEIFVPNPKEYGNLELMARNMLSGGAAGGASLMFVYPMDLARTRMTGDIGKEKRYKNFFDVIGQVYKNEGGVPGLYRGFLLSVVGIIPYRAVYFGGYDTLKKIFLENDPHPTFWKKWAISQTNTTFAQYLTYPIDTVRRRLMMKGEKHKAAAGGEAKPAVVYRNAWHCATVIVKEEGVSGLFKGAWANTIRATGGALCIVFYDELKEYMDKQNEQSA